ncbi:MAG: TIGR03545 family protein [Thiomicrospira sp.]|uniref:TIGR03545 family protein n=1 Tax=Thiomicrospira sp. TaxID=935 RepID=UPI001A002150|nr:TIGR03545 family protein [Thiomicrospira sp.]MBE0493841.1 TIGR03545 family protein [Thiomicrospira sp.]
MSEQNQTTQTPESTPTQKPAAKPIKPKGWIRWSGLIGVLIMVGLVFGLGYLVSSWALKSKIESVASNAWGAKVEIDDLSFSFDPIGIDLAGVQITDPEQPMQNLVELKQVRLSLNLYHLVVKRFVIEDITMAGLALNQPRQTSGVLPKPIKVASQPTEAETADKKSAGFKLPAAAMPDAKEVIARERLDTVDQAKRIETLATSTENEWKNIEDSLPTAQSLARYEAELKAIFEGKVKDHNDLKQREQRLKTLQKTWQADQAAIQQAQKFIQSRHTEISQGLGQLEKMPDQDLQRLLSSYSMDQSGLSNLTYLLFGESVQQKLQLALNWHRKALPLIKWIEEYRAKSAANKALVEQTKKPRALGENVAFQEFDQQPKFMIKRLDFDGDIEWGAITAKLRDVNFDQTFSQKPIRFNLSASPTTQKSALVMEGYSSTLETDKLLTSVQANWIDYQVNQWWMAKTDVLPVQLAQAKANLTGQMALTGLSQLDADLNIHYRDAVFDLSQTNSAQVTRYLAPAFADIHQFKVDASLRGRLLSPRISASSDLDNQLSAAFKQVFEQEMRAFKQDLEKQLQAKLTEIKQPIEAELQRLNIDQSALEDQEKALQVIQNEAQNQLKQSEAELKQRVEAEKKRLEKEAKQKVEDELRKRIKLPF